MEPGIYPDISNEAYHSGPGLSRSDFVKLLRSPAHYKFPPEEEKETPALLFGEAFHVAILQPKLFEKQYTTLPPDFDGRTTRGKALKADIEASGKQILKYDDFRAIDGMAKALLLHPEIARILETGIPEASCYWRDPAYPDILLKSRIDWLNMKESIILDLKSTTDARPGPFTKHAYDYHYHTQAAHYLSGVSIITGAEHRDFRFAAIEKESPYGLILYPAGDMFLQAGQIEVQKALRIYQDCMEKDYWPCYPTEMQELDIPEWVRRKMQNNVIIE